MTTGEGYSIGNGQVVNNGFVPSKGMHSYSVPHLRTVGARWIKKDGRWWKYWRRDYGLFIAEMPEYFTSFTVHYSGRPFDDS